MSWLLSLPVATIPAAMGEAKRKNQRQCPALGSTITAEDCGKNRNSRISCPLDCPFNPLAAGNFFSMFLPIEERLTKAIFPIMVKELSQSEVRELDRLAEAEDFYGHEAQCFWLLFGTGRLARWLEEGRFQSWRNDDQVVVKHQVSGRIALLESVCRLSDTTSLARDLLRPEDGERLVIDAALTGVLARYRAYLTWVYDLPSGWRPLGTAVDVPAVLPHGPRETLDILLDHLGAPAGTRDAWLFENMPLVKEAVFELKGGRGRAGLLAADCVEHLTTYRVNGSFRALMRALDGDARCVWADEEDGDGGQVYHVLEPGHDPAHPHGVPTLGRLVCWNDQIELACLGKDRHAAARRAVEEILGALVTFDHEQSALPEELKELRPPDSDLVPASLLENPPIVEVASRWLPAAKGDPERQEALEFHIRIERSLDQASPELGGRSPRAAAADQATRPLAVAWMKAAFTECDSRRLRGVDVDISDLARDLGLDELIQAPALLGEYRDDWDDDDESDEFDDDEDDLDGGPDDYGDWEWTPCPQVALSGAQVEERLRHLSEDPDKATDLVAQWSDLVDLIDDNATDDFPEHLLKLSFKACTTVAMILHPHRAPEVQPVFGRLARMVDQLINRLIDQLEQDPETMRAHLIAIATETPQPNACEVALNLYYRDAARHPQARQTPTDLLGLGAIIIVATAWELCHWPPAPLR